MVISFFWPYTQLQGRYIHLITGCFYSKYFIIPQQFLRTMNVILYYISYSTTNDYMSYSTTNDQFQSLKFWKIFYPGIVKVNIKIVRVSHIYLLTKNPSQMIVCGKR